jgi:hypothetical protein
MTPQDNPRARPTEREPKARRRRWRQVAVAAALFAFVGWLGMVVLWLQRSPASDADRPPPIPNPNGYDDLLQASRALKELMPVVRGNLPDYTEFETPALQDFVARIHDPLAQIREGLDRPFQVPYAYDLKVYTEWTMGRVGQIKAFVNRALQAEGLLARRESRLADEARSALDLIRVGNALGREVPMSAYLSSLPSVYGGAVGLRDMRDRLVADPDLCRKTIAEMARLDRDRPSVDRAIARESAFMNVNIKSFGVVASTITRVTGNLERPKKEALEALRAISKRSEAIRRLVLADLAVRLYQKEHQGAPPASLEALVPVILPRLPIDPFTDRPLIYRVVAQGYQLYSTGPDRDDDRLEPTVKQLGRNDSNGDATLESF